MNIWRKLQTLQTQVARVSALPVARAENLRPFFIIGSGRSGTTLLRRILFAHSALHIPPESYELGIAYHVYRRVRPLGWPYAVRSVLGVIGLYPEFYHFNMDLEPVEERLQAVPKDERSLAKIIDILYREHARQHKISMSRWGDKTPMNTFFLPQIDSIFPDAQYIHMLRDGCDVVESYLRTGLKEQLQDAASRWRRATQLAQQWVEQHAERAIVVRYEALSTAPEDEARRVCRFLGLPFEVAMIRKLDSVSSMGDASTLAHMKHVREPISSRYVGRGRERLSQAQRRALEQLIGRDLVRLGYPRPLLDANRGGM